MQNNNQSDKAAKEADFTGMHLSEITKVLGIPGDEEEIVNEQEQNEIVNAEEEGQTTNN